MNRLLDHEIQYHLLTLLADEPQLRQRDMARRMGISVGKVNYFVAEFVEKGLIQVQRIRSAGARMPYTYSLTPRGIEEKARVTVRFLRRKLQEFEDIKRQIETLVVDLEQNGLQEMAAAELTKAADMLQ